jgi:methionyl-tRNA formyltransferase
MTDVPFGRGGSPLQNLIVRGHDETVLSAIRCVSEVDAGPVYLKRPLDLSGTAEEILRRASSLMYEMIVQIVDEEPVPEAQRGEVTEFARRRPEDGNLELAPSLDAVYDWIRMLDGNGYPPAFLESGQLRLEFRGAERGPDSVTAKVTIRKADER